MKKRIPVKKSVPETVANIIDGVLSRNHIQLHFQELRFLKKCTERLGVDFCQHMKPYKFLNGIIYCFVDSPSWIQQYQFLSGEMKQKLNNPPMERSVNGFRFTVGSILEAEYINKEHTVHTGSHSKLSAQEADELYKVVQTIHPELQSELQNMIQLWTATQRNQNRQDTTDEF